MVATGLLKANRSYSANGIAWLLADFPARVITLESGSCLGAQLILVDEHKDQKLIGIASTLAACTDYIDFGLQKNIDHWWLWRYYDCELDDKELKPTLIHQLNLINFLEKTPTNADKMQTFYGK